MTEIPTTWQKKALESLCSLRRELEQPSVDGANRYLGLEHLDSGHSSIRRSASDLGVRSTKSRFYAGDVLYGKLRPYLDKVAVADWSGVCSTDILTLVPTSGEADPRFLAFALHTKSFLAHAIATTSGVNHPRTSWRDIADFTLAVPPLPEQRVIASFLLRIEAAIEREVERIASLKELKTATMARVFSAGLRSETLRQTSLGALPLSWRVASLGSIAKIGNGSTPSRLNPAYWVGGSIPWITSSKVHDALIRAAEEFVTEIAFRECHLPLVPKGSIVIAITGQGKTLGNVAMTMLDTCINQHLAYAQITSDDVMAEFILHYLQTRYADLRSIGFGGGSTKGALTCGFLKTYPIPLPEMSEQREIASIIGKLSERIEIAMKRRTVLGELFSAALQQLMIGQLRFTSLVEGQPNTHA
jgi:type I restriction enzyme S subunit